MPTTHKVLIHQRGPALWPEHKSLEEVQDLQATTPEHVWSGTYQGIPTPPGGQDFKREWWAEGKNRYHIDAPRSIAATEQVIARWISWDTGMKDKQENAFTAACVGDLMADYRLRIREVYRERLTFPELVGDTQSGEGAIQRFYRRYARDEKLRGILIEDKASGTSAYQTLSQAEDVSIRRLLHPFMPTTSKRERAQQAAVWCKLGSVLLPFPSDQCPWLFDFTDELWSFPGSTFSDQVDSFSQMIIYLEHLLSEGYRARQGRE